MINYYFYNYKIFKNKFREKFIFMSNFKLTQNKNFYNKSKNYNKKI